MESLSTRLMTLFPSARWPRRWRPPRGGDLATAGNVPGPVGYLVNHNDGLAGVQGIGYDYVLGSGRPLRPVREREPDGAGAGLTPARCGGSLP